MLAPRGARDLWPLATMRPSTFLTLAASFAQLAAGSPVLSEASAIARSLVLAPLYTPPAPPTPIIDGSRAASAEDGHASHLVPDGYIVVLDDHLSPREVDQHHAHVDALHAQHVAALGAGADDAAPKGVRHKYHVGKPHQGKRHLKGYSGHFAQDTVDKIRALKGVKYVERDSLVWTTEVQRGAPWVRASYLTKHHYCWVSTILISSLTGPCTYLAPQAAWLWHVQPLRVRL